MHSFTHKAKFEIVNDHVCISAVYGQVVSPDGHPVAGSWVQFDYETDKFSTHKDGYFYRILSKGNHTVTARAPGTYATSMRASINRIMHQHECGNVCCMCKFTYIWH